MGVTSRDCVAAHTERKRTRLASANAPVPAVCLGFECGAETAQDAPVPIFFLKVLSRLSGFWSRDTNSLLINTLA